MTSFRDVYVIAFKMKLNKPGWANRCVRSGLVCAKKNFFSDFGPFSSVLPEWTEIRMDGRTDIRTDGYHLGGLIDSTL